MPSSLTLSYSDVHPSCMSYGVENGWWPSFDNRTPHPWPYCYVMESSEIRREHYVPGWEWEGGLWKTLKVESHKYMSQLLVSLGVFESVSEARKAGHDKPIQPGEFWFKRNRVGTLHLFIETD